MRVLMRGVRRGKGVFGLTTRRTALVLAVAIVLAPASRPGGAEGDSDGDPRGCERVEIVDSQSGDPVVGAEDFVVDPVSRRIFVAAYDRRKLDQAVSAGAAALPQGGIYAAPLRSLERRPDRLPIRRVADGGEPDFHPHGLALYRDADSARLFAVNHAYVRQGGGWQRTTQLVIYRITADGLAREQRVRDDALCRANNVAALSPRDLLITRDHSACGAMGRWMEDVLGLARGQVVLGTLGGDEGIRLETLVDDVSYANGIAVSPDGGRVAVAATREERIRFYDTSALVSRSDDALETIVNLDGGPDNLAWTSDGRLVAAVHPSLLFAGLARHGWFGVTRSGSKVIAVSPDDAVTETLFHDPSGKRLNASTAARLVDDTLIVSAVLDSALLVCRR